MKPNLSENSHFWWTKGKDATHIRNGRLYSSQLGKHPSVAKAIVLLLIFVARINPCPFKGTAFFSKTTAFFSNTVISFAMAFVLLAP